MAEFKLFCVGRMVCCVGAMVIAGTLPVSRNEWNMDGSDAGFLLTTLNISNAIALFTASWLSDLYGSRKLYLIFSWAGCVALFLFGFFAHSYSSAVFLMVFIGITQGGTYTPAIMLAIKLNSVAKRGYAVGLLMAASSLGYLLSLLTSAAGSLVWGTNAAFYVCAGCVFGGCILSTLALRNIDDSVLPHREKKEHASIDNQKTWSTLSVLLLIGYIAHCWELLGSWAWTPSLIFSVLTPHENSPLVNSMLIATAIHLSGGLSSIIVGALSDYVNRSNVLIVMGGMGGLCSLLTGYSGEWGAGWVLLCVFAGNFFILGDSGVLSAAIADNVPHHTLGRVMGIRSLLGFGIGSLSPFCFGIVLDQTGEWEVSYVVLAAGGGVAFITAGIMRFQTKINKFTSGRPH